MPTVTLGRTNLTVEKNGFGALPIQRISKEEAEGLLKRAYEGGITFFDTARAYTDSEEKIGRALSGVRRNLVIATKTHAQSAAEFRAHLETSLRLLRTEYVDIYQLHNPSFCPKPGGEDGLYDAMLQARAQGKVRFIGITNHRLPVAREAVASGLYDTLQYPFHYLATPQEEELVRSCAEANMGFIAMKALSGGLITRPEAAYAFLAPYAHVIPIWGIQRERELEDFLRFFKDPPRMTPELEAVIQKDREELAGNFCRGCGYCLPCPAGIEISDCARMSLLIRRAPSEQYLSQAWREKMDRIEQCTHCGRCKSKCPYSLDTPRLLEENLKDYRELLAGKPLERAWNS